MTPRASRAGRSKSGTTVASAERAAEESRSRGRCPAWQREATVPGIPKAGQRRLQANAAGVEKKFGYPTNFCQSKVSGATSATPCRTAARRLVAGRRVHGRNHGLPGRASAAGGRRAARRRRRRSGRRCSRSSTPRRRAHPGPPRAAASDSRIRCCTRSRLNPGEYPAAFNDVSRGNNDIYGLDNGLVFPATSGYDLASGLGLAAAQRAGRHGRAGLLPVHARSESEPTGRHSELSPASGSVAGAEKINISGRGFEPGGKPAVAFVEVGNAQLGPASFHLVSATAISATVPACQGHSSPQFPCPPGRRRAGGGDRGPARRRHKRADPTLDVPVRRHEPPQERARDHRSDPDWRRRGGAGSGDDPRVRLHRREPRHLRWRARNQI